jgi:Protein of unknown function (DUF1460)
MVRCAFTTTLIVLLVCGGSTVALAQPAPSTQPLYQLNESQIDAFLRQLHRDVPDLRQRIVTIARRNISQPYQIYLLGEAPFETIDPEPVYCLHHSDCVVFAEHTLAMALCDNWPQFLAMLQRIRYRGGQVGVLTRNHYTEADWNTSNSWLAPDITRELDPAIVAAFSCRIDRARFFKSRYKLDIDLPVQEWNDAYIPYGQIDKVKSKLRDGDVVNFVTGGVSVASVTHVGLIGLGKDGAVNLIHSAAPAVREEPIEAYIQRMTRDAAEKDAAGKPRFRGFKFLRVADDPWKNLRAIDGPEAPRVSLPKSSKVTWEQYLESFAIPRHEPR